MSRPLLRPLGRALGAALGLGVALAVSCAPQRGGEGGAASPRAEASPETQLQLLHRLEEESWYAVSVGGRRMGHAYFASAVRETGPPALVVTQKTAFQIEHQGLKLRAATTQTTIYDAGLHPQEFLLDSDQLGQKVTLQARVQGRTLLLKTDRGGSVTEQQLALGPTFGGEVEIARRILDGKLQVGDQFAFQTFLAEMGSLDELQVKVVAREDLTFGGRPVPTYRLAAKSKALGFEATSWMTEEGSTLRQDVPGLLGGVRMERVTEQEALAEVSPLEIVNKIEVGVLIPDAPQVKSMKLGARGGGVSVADLIPSDHRQRVEASAKDPTRGTIELTADSLEGAEGPDLPVQDPALREWLQPTEFVESQDPEIQATAAKVAGAERNSRRVAERLLDWVHREMKKVSSEPAPITARQCLKQMSGDCSEHAVLLTALARARGLPCKFVTGLVYARGAFYYHAWNEVYVGRWVAVDPAWGEAGVDAGHLKLAEATLDSTSFARSCLATGRTMGALALEVESYTTPDGQAHHPQRRSLDTPDRRPFLSP